MSTSLTERPKSLPQNQPTHHQAKSLKNREVCRPRNTNEFRDVAGSSPLAEHSFKKSIRDLNFWPSSFTSRVYKTPKISYEPSFAHSNHSVAMTAKDYKIVLRQKHHSVRHSIIASKLIRESVAPKQSNFASLTAPVNIEKNQRRSVDLSARHVQSSKHVNHSLFRELNTKIVSKIVASRLADKAKSNGVAHQPISLPKIQREIENFVGNFTVLVNKFEPTAFNYEKIQKTVKKALATSPNPLSTNTQNVHVPDETSRRIMSAINSRKIAETILKFESSIQELTVRKDNIKRLKTQFGNIEGEIDSCNRAFLNSIREEVI
jgi:hypothetical protein